MFCTSLNFVVIVDNFEMPKSINFIFFLLFLHRYVWGEEEEQQQRMINEGRMRKENNYEE